MIRTLRGFLAASTAFAALALAPGFAAPALAERFIVFGDSLSDGGFYTTILPAGAFEPGEGSFTTNPDDVAPEVTAAAIGAELDIAYSVGGVPDAGFNYAIGGARVARANPLNPFNPLSVSAQIDTFLATGRRFGAGDVVYIQGGGNDLFNLGAGPDAGNVPLFLSAATELARQVERVENAGAGTVVTLNVQSGGDPFVQAFNATFEGQLAAQGSNVLFFDNDALFNEIAADAFQGGQTFGITNVTGSACTPGLSSLFCSRSDLVAPDANETFLLADTVHPAGRTQRIQGQAIASLLRAPGQVGELANAAEALFRDHADLGRLAWRNRRALPADTADDGEGANAFAPGARPGVTVFAGASGHLYATEGGGILSGISQRAATFALGANVPVSAFASVGGFVSYSAIGGGFNGLGGAPEGDLDGDAFAVSAFVRGEAGIVRFVADATYGRAFYDVVRDVALGPAVRAQRGRTDGDYHAVRAEVEADAFRSGGFVLGPSVAIGYSNVSIDAFADRAGALPTSTDIAFGGQDAESLTGRIGLFAAGQVGETEAGLVRLHARVSYEHDFLGGNRAITITPQGAPVSFTTPLRERDDDYLSFEVNVAVPVRANMEFRAGASGDVFRSGETNLAAKAGFSISF